MVAGFKETAVHLWREAPYWRLSVLGAGIFSLLSVVYIWQGPTAVGPSAFTAPPTPALPPDPASDARLADYDTAFGQAAKISEAGLRCEQVAGAFDTLTPDDRLRGRNVRASSRARIAALADGERCHNDISKSDDHFAALAHAADAAANNPSLQFLQATVTALKSLDAFDKSRGRFKAEAPLISQSQNDADALSASDDRMAAVTTAVASLQHDRTPQSYLRVVDALAHLTDLDHDRMAGSQASVLASATDASRTVQDSRVRLSRLGRIMAASHTAQDSEVQQQLIDVTSAITTFDEAVATPEQRQLIAQARAAATAFAWSTLRARLSDLAQDGRVSDYQAVGAIYLLLKNVDLSTLNHDQKRLLEEAQDATDKLAVSDTHLQDVLSASAQWKQVGIPSGDAVLNAVRETTSFDQRRFQTQHKEAWAILKRAEAIIRGPELGFTAATRDRLRIFVVDTAGSQNDSNLAISLGSALQRSGFLVADDRKDAALIADVEIQSLSSPQQDLSGGFLAWSVTAQVAVRMSWSADDSVLFADTISTTGNSQNERAATAQGLLAAVDKIVSRIQSASR